MQPETRPRGFITTQRLTAESRAKFLRTRAQLAPLEQAANTPFYEQGGNRDVRFELFDVQRTRAAMTLSFPTTRRCAIASHACRYPTRFPQRRVVGKDKVIAARAAASYT